MPAGSQAPRILHAPPRASSAGLEAVELAELAGLHLDPWQQLVLHEALGEQPDGQWSAFEVALIVPRQNGKGSILEARELAGLFVLGERLIIHTAHLFPTAQEAFRRILDLIEDTPDLDRRVAKVSRSHGDEGIELKSGQRLLFKARSRGGGRGFTGDCVILDEAFELPVAAHGALLPTLSARPNPQVWYASSAVNQRLHPHGMVLSQVRRRALQGSDPSLCLAEWSVDPDVYLASPLEAQRDRRLWAQANPGLAVRITEEHVERERAAMDMETFAVERLGVGDWPNPDESAQHVIDLEVWGQLADPLSASSKAAPGKRIEGPVAFALDMNPERTWTSIGMAGRRQDGLRHVQLVDHREGARWAVGRIVELTGRFDTCVVMVDSHSPAAALVPELVEAGLTVRRSDGAGLLVTSALGDMVQACGGLYDDVLSGRLRHRDDPALQDALRAAKKKDRGDAWTWSRQALADISPLVAVTLARHGLMTYGQESAEPFFLT